VSQRKKLEKKQADMLTLTDLEQVRVLADPLRLRIVEKLCDAELTTKQVAEALGEKPTKLYHHVEALEKVGLIRQTRTKRNRGTLERYYLAVARRFKTDATIFAGEDSPPAASALHSVVTTIIETTARELGELAGHGIGDPSDPQGILTFVYLEAEEKTITRLQRRLQRFVNDVQALDTIDGGDDAPDDGPPKRKYRLTLAFYPLDIKDGDAP
jgi:DNA-binding transcriptional ArsR family regulator